MRTLGAVLVLASALAACGTSPTPSAPTLRTAAPSGSASPAAALESAAPATTPSATANASSVDPSPQPTQQPRATDRDPGPRPPFRRGDRITTTTPDLRVRSLPEVGGDSIRYTPLLAEGTIGRVLRGPVSGSGYWWYRVQLEEVVLYDDVVTGWIAAADHDGTPWVGETRADPPAPAALEAFGSADVDGVLAPREWEDAAQYPFEAWLPGGGTTPAMLYLMNDDLNLYLAVAVDGAYELTFPLFQVRRNEELGTWDVLRAAFYGGGPGPAGFWDSYMDSTNENGTYLIRDIETAPGLPPPGTEEGEAWGGEQDGVTVVEVSHPLRSADASHDVQLSPGDRQRLWLEFTLKNGEQRATNDEVNVPFRVAPS